MASSTSPFDLEAYVATHLGAQAGDDGALRLPAASRVAVFVACLLAGSCPRCAFRFLDVAREVMYRVPDAALRKACLRVLAQCGYLPPAADAAAAGTSAEWLAALLHIGETAACTGCAGALQAGPVLVSHNAERTQQWGCSIERAWRTERVEVRGDRTWPALTAAPPVRGARGAATPAGGADAGDAGSGGGASGSTGDGSGLGLGGDGLIAATTSTPSLLPEHVLRAFDDGVAAAASAAADAAAADAAPGGAAAAARKAVASKAAPAAATAALGAADTAATVSNSGVGAAPASSDAAASVEEQAEEAALARAAGCGAFLPVPAEWQEAVASAVAVCGYDLRGGVSIILAAPGSERLEYQDPASPAAIRQLLHAPGGLASVDDDLYKAVTLVMYHMQVACTAAGGRLLRQCHGAAAEGSAEVASEAGAPGRTQSPPFMSPLSSVLYNALLHAFADGYMRSALQTAGHVPSEAGATGAAALPPRSLATGLAAIPSLVPPVRPSGARRGIKECVRGLVAQSLQRIRVEPLTDLQQLAAHKLAARDASGSAPTASRGGSALVAPIGGTSVFPSMESAATPVVLTVHEYEQFASRVHTEFAAARSLLATTAAATASEPASAAPSLASLRGAAPSSFTSKVALLPTASTGDVAIPVPEPDLWPGKSVVPLGAGPVVGSGAAAAGAAADLDDDAKRQALAATAVHTPALRPSNINQLHAVDLSRVWVDVGGGVAATACRVPELPDIDADGDDADAVDRWQEAALAGVSINDEDLCAVDSAMPLVSSWPRLAADLRASVRLNITVTVEPPHPRPAASAGAAAVAVADAAASSVTGDAATSPSSSSLSTVRVAPPRARIAFFIDRQPFLLAGRYCKYSRSLAQTAWIVDGKRVGDTSSVDEITSGTASLALDGVMTPLTPLHAAAASIVAGSSAGRQPTGAPLLPSQAYKGDGTEGGAYAYAPHGASLSAASGLSTTTDEAPAAPSGWHLLPRFPVKDVMPLPLAATSTAPLTSADVLALGCSPASTRFVPRASPLRDGAGTGGAALRFGMHSPFAAPRTVASGSGAAAVGSSSGAAARRVAFLCALFAHRSAACAPSPSMHPPIAKFHSAGREDIDVRMLGPGRPCMIEIADSRVGGVVPALWLLALQNAINTTAASWGEVIEFKGCRPASRTEFVALSVGAQDKRKRYAAVCWCSEPRSPAQMQALLAARKDVKVEQITPLRVLHRRTLMARHKTIHDMTVMPINPHYFVLYLTTSAGTYIKEFVHGDLGRTSPSVGELLGCEADIMQLDVVDLLQYKSGGTGKGKTGGSGGGDDDEDDEDEEEDEDAAPAVAGPAAAATAGDDAAEGEPAAKRPCVR